MIIINLVGLVVIGLIVWWFWFYKPIDVSLNNDELVITVESGSYSPARLKLMAHTPSRLSFLRKDASPCAEVVLFPNLDISETLPLNKTNVIELPALEPGEYPFHCQMQMYRGVIIVE